MLTLSLTEFRAHASEMLDLVAKGDTVRILRHGKPVAELVPVRDAAAVKPATFRNAFEPLMSLPADYSAVERLLDERARGGW